MKNYSPLRYPGGKKKLIRFFKELFERDKWKGGVYVETYTGGSAIALFLAIEGNVSKVIINDFDRSIYAFWYSVLNKNEELCELIRTTKLTIENWKEQKLIQKNKETCNLLTLGFSTFFLNRTNFSGIINAGVIGGIKQKGKWKIGSRYNQKELIEKIKKIAEHRDKIELCKEDAKKLIHRLRKNLPDKTIFYLDPPYYIKGKELYMNYYNEEDHHLISLEVKKIKNKGWIITYDNVIPIKKLYKNYIKKPFSLRYSAGNNNLGKEIAVFSDNLSKESKTFNP